MEQFTLTLANGATLTGLSNTPPSSFPSPKYKPLMVGLHGGSYSAAYFDVDSQHTAAIASNALGVPWVAIDRPGYKGSTSFYPIPARSSFPELYGSWLHELALPALWDSFGAPQGCTTIVLLCHSLGTPGAVIAASHYSSSPFPQQRYPLGGVIFSGFGSKLIPGRSSVDPHGPSSPPEFLCFTPQVKDGLMIPPGTCDPAIYKHTERLNTEFPSREVADIHSVWNVRFHADWAVKVQVPVMFGIAEHDCYWRPDQEHVADLLRAFVNSPRVEGGVVRGAPHNIEMSYWAAGWYARCFGFGIECAASAGVVGAGEGIETDGKIEGEGV